MSKNILYYGFNEVGKYSGTQLDASIGTETATEGSICQPSDVVKLSAGTNAWEQDIQIIDDFLSGEIEISSMTAIDWSIIQKENWFNSYLKYTGLETLINSTYYSELFNIIESNNIFEHLSGASIAYVTQSPSSGEISIGCTVYEYDFLLQHGLSLPVGNDLRNIILSNHIIKTPYISNVFKVNYNGFIDVVWCFDGIIYDNYNISNLSNEPSLTNGGGNIFGEVKLAGDGLRAHYIVKKNIDSNDPTMGLCSGDDKPFCMGDQIVIIDTTTWTENNGTSGWTWVGDFTQLEYIWHIADVTNPCTDYRAVPIFDMFFPLRVIEHCQFLDFN